MTWRAYLLLSLLGLACVMIVAALQPSPGYMDADYYYAGGLQLAVGKGFTEAYLWNYLDDPTGLPHPAFTYWMPLASLLTALVPALFENSSWFLIRIPLFFIAACLPALTAALAFTLSHNRSLSFASGLLAVFSGFYLPFLATTDTFAIYMFLGGAFFLVTHRLVTGRGRSSVNALLLGLLAGLMHLSRADGLLWLAVAMLALVFVRKYLHRRGGWLGCLAGFVAVLGGYILVMGPWFLHNHVTYSSLLAPGGSRMLWLTSYDQIFTYPAEDLTLQSWWQSGLGAILRARTWSLGLNASTAFAVQGGVFLLPFILIAGWHLRKEKLIQLAGLSWVLVLLAMTLAFPFAGARGGFFHAGAALQPVWWALAPIGLERFIQWGHRKRGWIEARARPVFLSGMVGLVIFLSILVAFLRLPGWGQEAARYQQLAAFLGAQGAGSSEVVIVSNPPGFFLASQNPAIALPDGDTATILALAERYAARYLILEPGAIPAGILPLYESPQAYPGLVYLGEVEEARVFRIQP
jgi:hypothetical protein